MRNCQHTINQRSAPHKTNNGGDAREPRGERRYTAVAATPQRVFGGARSSTVFGYSDTRSLYYDRRRLMQLVLPAAPRYTCAHSESASFPGMMIVHAPDITKYLLTLP